MGSDCRALFSCNVHRLITSLQKQSKKLYTKQFITLESLVFIGKSQMLALPY